MIFYDQKKKYIFYDFVFFCTIILTQSFFTFSSIIKRANQYIYTIWSCNIFWVQKNGRQLLN